MSALSEESAFMNPKIDDDMPDEIDFSKGTRGKFHRPGAIARLPIYLDSDVESYLSQRATAKGIELTALVNQLLKKEIEIIESVK